MGSSKVNGSNPSEPSQSAKKRKATAEVSEPSKKKRKHDKDTNGVTESQETLVSKTERKEKKRKKKDRKREQEEEIDEAPTVVEAEDIELPDVSTKATTPVEEPALNGVLDVDGMDTENMVDEIEEIDSSLLESQTPSSFYEKRISLQLPIPGISLASPTSSLLSLHLAPLLLTYFPPADGIVLSFSDPVLSAKPSFGINLPLQRPKKGEIARDPADETFARCADGFGVCWVWLTATFLLFRPEKGDELKGWTNVTSEGFVGLVSYNYFQTAVGRSRIPKTWVWDGPTRESRKNKKTPRKGKLRDEDGVHESQETIVDSQDISYTPTMAEGGSGTYMDSEGVTILPGQTFKVVDIEMVPGSEKNRFTLQIDGSLLSPEEEEAAIAVERQRFEQMQNRNRSRSRTPGLEAGDMPLLTGTLPFSRAGSEE